MYRILKCNVMFLGIMLVFLFSCGGGHRNVDTITITVGSVTTVYNERPIDNEIHYNPFIVSSSFHNSTRIFMCSYVSLEECIIQINIVAGGTDPGTYAIIGGESTSTYVTYRDNGQYYESVAGNGTITITSIGNEGEPITGSFEAVLELQTDPSETLTISGTVSATRDDPDGGVAAVQKRASAEEQE